ncbi:MAG TPA: hybrid sensor histidine kinase/response regulator [Porticoccus sp.]|nr:hybrid sensor histidine kinase/response regulator [Porticoccus sp.]
MPAPIYSHVRANLYRWRFSFCSMLLALLILTVSHNSSADALMIEKSTQIGDLRSFYNVVNDPGEQLHPQQLIESFRRLQNGGHDENDKGIEWRDYPSLYESQQGIEKTTVWAALEIANHTNTYLSLVLVLSHMIAPYDTTVWHFSGTQQLTESFVGERYTFAQRPLEHRDYLVPVNIAEGSTATLLIRTRVVGDKSYILNNVELHTEREYLLADSTVVLGDGIYYGLSLFLLVTSLLLAAQLKSRAFLYYSAFLFSTMVYLSSGDGYGAQYLWQESTWLNRRTEYIGRLTAFSFVLLLSMRLLGRNSMHRALLWGCRVAIGAAVMGVISCAILETNYSILVWVIYSFLVMIPMALALFIYSAVLWSRGDDRGKQYFLVWSPYITFTSLAPLLVLTQVITGADSLGFFAKLFILITSLVVFISMSLRLGKMQVDRQVAVTESRTKSEFLAKMSHEIRTPMNGVLGMSELLSGTQLTVIQKSYNDTIFNSGQSLLGVINDILDYSKISAGKFDIEDVDFNIELLLRDCTSLFSAILKERKIELICRLAPDMPAAYSGDESRIRQVVINLVGNAFKFTEHGEVFINVEPVADTGLIRFSVRDTGIGITPEQQKNLFASFSQADVSTSRKYGGTGLGLTICKQLVELMGGEIGIESTYGMGSTFWFELPLTPVHDSRSQPPVSVEALRNIRLLMVEDNLTYCEVVVETLQAHGVFIDVAYNGKEGLAAYEVSLKDGRPYDIISTDIDMPVMGGIEFMKTLHERYADISAVRIILSVTSALPHSDEYRKWGVELTTRKPILSTELLSTFARALGKEPDLKTVHTEQEYEGDKSLLHVLVAEDNMVNFLVVSAFLRKLGHSIDHAEDGLSAVEKFKSRNLNKHTSNYDVIFMDCEMPGIDGFEAVRIIRQLEQDLNIPACPIIALTAHAVKEYLDKCIASGMDNYLVKPISMDSVAETIAGLPTVE